MERLITRFRPYIDLTAWMGLCFAAMLAGSYLTAPGLPVWYANLLKPEWTPPNWVFGPVWFVLYTMMGIAVWLVWRQGGLFRTKLPIIFFVVQLLLNVLWSYLFFSLRAPMFAFAEIVVLWLAILATTIAFWQASRPAGLLMLPTLAWVAYAGVLNFYLWRMNLP
jgi:tryptophan-rich sensory protein